MGKLDPETWVSKRDMRGMLHYFLLLLTPPTHISLPVVPPPTGKNTSSNWVEKYGSGGEFGVESLEFHILSRLFCFQSHLWKSSLVCSLLTMLYITSWRLMAASS